MSCQVWGFAKWYIITMDVQTSGVSQDGEITQIMEGPHSLRQSHMIAKPAQLERPLKTAGRSQYVNGMRSPRFGDIKDDAVVKRENLPTIHISLYKIKDD